MWIRLLLCTKDAVYAGRFIAFFEREYGDKLEISHFSDVEYLMESMEEHPADFILFGEEFEENALSYANKLSCTWAVLINQMYETDNDSFIRIAKYQRADRLYKAILDAYSQGSKVKRLGSLNKDNEKTKVYVFLAAGGGVGTTTIARAYARKCAVYEKALYLDLGILALPWTSEGQEHGLDDIMLALKSRRDILSIKLESAVTDTQDKVYTYNAGTNPWNLLELTETDITRLVEGIRALGEYRKIIFDVGTCLTEKEIALFTCADHMICVVEDNGNRAGRVKYDRLCEVLRLLEQKANTKLLRKMRVFRNKAVKNEEAVWNSPDIREAGWAPRIEQLSYDAVENRIMQSDAFDHMEINDEG